MRRDGIPRYRRPVLVASARTEEGSVGTFSLAMGRRASHGDFDRRSAEPHRLDVCSAAPAVIPRYELASLSWLVRESAG